MVYYTTATEKQSAGVPPNTYGCTRDSGDAITSGCTLQISKQTKHNAHTEASYSLLTGLHMLSKTNTTLFTLHWYTAWSTLIYSLVYTDIQPGLHWSTLVYTGLHWSTLVYTGLHWYTAWSTLVYTGLHWYTAWSTLVYTGLHWYTAWSTLVYTGLHWYTAWSTLVYTVRGVAAGSAGPALTGPLFFTLCQKCPECRILHPNFKIFTGHPGPPSGRTTSNDGATRLTVYRQNSTLLWSKCSMQESIQVSPIPGNFLEPPQPVFDRLKLLATGWKVTNQFQPPVLFCGWMELWMVKRFFLDGYFQRSRVGWY